MVAVLLGVAPTLALAQGPYEPNETILDAAGPLTVDQPLVATLETLSDQDVFFFYVTSADELQVTLTVKNLGGSGKTSDLSAAITDSSLTSVGGLSYISNGESKTAVLTLKPQKYFVEVTHGPGETFGDTYSITGSGGKGAFGTYEQIAARCQSATTAAARAKTKLRRAQAKLQRVTARVRRSRYSGDEARQATRVAYRKAKARVSTGKGEVEAAKASRKPWCFIAE